MPYTHTSTHILTYVQCTHTYNTQGVLNTHTHTPIAIRKREKKMKQKKQTKKKEEKPVFKLCGIHVTLWFRPFTVGIDEEHFLIRSQHDKHLIVWYMLSYILHRTYELRFLTEKFYLHSKSDRFKCSRATRMHLCVQYFELTFSILRTNFIRTHSTHLKWKFTYAIHIHSYSRIKNTHFFHNSISYFS